MDLPNLLQSHSDDVDTHEDFPEISNKRDDSESNSISSTQVFVEH